MDTTFNLFDLAFLFGLVIFIAMAFFRGFVREIFALINWVIAIFATLFLSDLISKGLGSFLSQGFVVNVVSIILSFIVVFIFSTILTRRFGTIVKEKIPYNTDQILGVAYGFLKTFLIFGLIYSFTVNGHGIIFGSNSKTKYKDSMPSWLYESKFRSVISPFGNTLDPVAKMILGNIGPKINMNKVKKGKKEQEKKGSSSILGIFNGSNDSKKVKKLKPYGIFEKNSKKTGEKIENTGYDKKQIEKMDRLIEIVE